MSLQRAAPAFVETGRATRHDNEHRRKGCCRTRRRESFKEQKEFLRSYSPAALRSRRPSSIACKLQPQMETSPEQRKSFAGPRKNPGETGKHHQQHKKHSTNQKQVQPGPMPLPRPRFFRVCEEQGAELAQIAFDSQGNQSDPGKEERHNEGDDPSPWSLGDPASVPGDEQSIHERHRGTEPRNDSVGHGQHRKTGDTAA